MLSRSLSAWGKAILVRQEAVEPVENPPRPACISRAIRMFRGRGGSLSLIFELRDYSVVVKQRAASPNSWRREIYRAGRSTPIKSVRHFESMVSATREGKVELKLLLDNRTNSILDGATAPSVPANPT
jgi:hypothetical protein